MSLGRYVEWIDGGGRHKDNELRAELPFGMCGDSEMFARDGSRRFPVATDNLFPFYMYDLITCSSTPPPSQRAPPSL